MRIIAILLIVLGVLGFVYQGFTFWTEKTMVDTPVAKVKTQEPHTVWVPPVVAGAAIVAGAVMLGLSSDRRD
jgi:hypothetical protein